MAARQQARRAPQAQRVAQPLVQERQVQDRQAPEAKPLDTWLTPRLEVALYVGLVLLALVMRLWDLGGRALHHDESLHATYSWYLYAGRGYQHNPMMHGPFQFFAPAFTFFLFGDTDFTARLSHALFGTALVGLPWLLRRQMGRVAALATALLLAFSPTMFYFSRFAREDMYMAVWSLGLVICIWRYLDEQKNRYLYILAGVLAFAFSTKENSYLLTLAMGGFLFLLSLGDLRLWVLGRKRLSKFGPSGVLLLLLVTLTLPQWSGLIALLQNKLGIVLANTDWTKGGVGLPQGGAIWIAAMVVGLAFGVSFILGSAWNWRVWLVCAAIFYGIWLTLYTTFYTNPFGALSGVWQGLGYWIAQQGVARGGQPWYYYFVIGWVYEFLAFLLALGGAIYYARKGDLFSRFLIFWAVLGFLLYTGAAEKMPWLLVHVALPFIILAGRTLGDLVRQVPWREAWNRGALLGLAFLPIFLVFAYRLLFYKVGRVSPGGFLSLWGLLLLTLSLLALTLLLVFRVGHTAQASGRPRDLASRPDEGIAGLEAQPRRWRSGLALLAVGGVAILFLFTVRAGMRAVFLNGDVPVEMLVYTQTSPDLPRISRDVHRIAATTGQKDQLKITVDGADGFAWPWVWYFRDFKSVGYPDYTGSASAPTDASVVLVNANNYNEMKGKLAAGYIEVGRYYHRWWFPESYRGVTPKVFLAGLKDRKVWRKAMDYWLYRKFDTPLGHIDAYLFYSKSILPMALPVPGGS
ncbi:MAG: TIGR03663 family protein [Chloroflexi bacterium]|nr:TIGR03663 family protein [Chloroflexota bacterium]